MSTQRRYKARKRFRLEGRTYGPAKGEQHDFWPLRTTISSRTFLNLLKAGYIVPPQDADLEELRKRDQKREAEQRKVREAEETEAAMAKNRESEDGQETEAEVAKSGAGGD